jgi:hypothetical protein
MSLTSILTTTLTIAGFVCSALGDDRAADGTSLRPVGEMIAKLRAEAARLETGHASDLFAALSEPETAARLKLSGVQADLVGRLDKLVRDVQKAWLIRGLDDHPAPSPVELAQRLSEPGQRQRAGLLAHAEAIALEGVLEGNQANRLLRKAGGRAPKPLAGRYPSIRMPSDDPPPQNKGMADDHIRSLSRMLAKPSFFVSELYRILLGWDEPGQDERNTLGFSKEQAELIRRLNELARDVQRDWLVRSLEGPDPVPLEHWGDPPQLRMVERLSETGQRLRASLVAHAEAIALEGVLEPDRALRAKRRLWSRSGLTQLADPRMAASREIMALLDPEVAAALHLSRAQRDDLVARFEARAAVAYELNKLVCGEKSELYDAAWTRGEITEDQRVAMEQRVATNARLRIMRAEQAIWDVLTSSQIRAFRRLISDSEPKQPEKPPSSQKRPGRSN